MLGEFVISSVLSHHNKNLKWWTSVTALRQTSVTSLGWTSITALCYSSVLFRKWQENTSLRCEGMLTQMTHKTSPILYKFIYIYIYIYICFICFSVICFSLFICFSPPPPPPPTWSLPYVNWASQECCLFYLRSSLWSLDLPLFYFPGLFPSLSFSHHHSGLLFPILTT